MVTLFNIRAAGEWSSASLCAGDCVFEQHLHCSSEHSRHINRIVNSAVLLSQSCAFEKGDLNIMCNVVCYSFISYREWSIVIYTVHVCANMS